MTTKVLCHKLKVARNLSYSNLLCLSTNVQHKKDLETNQLFKGQSGNASFVKHLAIPRDTQNETSEIREK